MATPKVDIETVSAAIEAFMKQKLNAKLLELDAEKNDGMVLVPIPEAAYFFEYYGTALANFNPSVLYGFDEITVGDRVGPASVQAVRMNIAVLLYDDGNDQLIVKRMLRYQRALKEIFEKDWNGVAGSLKFAVSGAAPFPIKLLNRNEPDRIIGINLEYELA